MKDYYRMLQLDRQATQKEIKKAYRELALLYHPDRNQSREAEEKFKHINEAYSVLADARKRHYYDRYGRMPRMYSRFYHLGITPIALLVAPSGDIVDTQFVAIPQVEPSTVHHGMRPGGARSGIVDLQSAGDFEPCGLRPGQGHFPIV